jgi:4-diphosphocytidyl-2-C-methyl-D-erythritol kinase
MTTLIAPAKLNLFLSIGDVRPDGFHAVTAVNAVLDFGDEVVVEPAEALSLVCEPPVGVPETENLAWRAATAMGEAFGASPDFRISVTKRIPAGAGLGGGSADAAAVIAAIAGAWDVQRTDPKLEAVASSLGADVPMFLQGGCAAYAGRGDVRRRTLPVPVGHVAIVWPGAHISTADAYRAFDEEPRGPRPAPSALTDAICFRDVAAIGAALHNNMTASSIRLAPVTADALAFVKVAVGCAGAAMAGSGSAVFGVFAERADAERAAAEAAAKGWWSTVAGFAAGGTLEQVMGAAGDTDQGRRRHPRRR